MFLLYKEIIEDNVQEKITPPYIQWSHRLYLTQPDIIFHKHLQEIYLMNAIHEQGLLVFVA